MSRRFAGRRAAWVSVGTLVGVLSALVFSWRLGVAAPPAPRTLAVGADAYGFRRIADAVASARAGDVIQLEPGTYDEEVVLPDGIDLIARVPGTATLRRRENAAGDWTAVAAAGSGRVGGIRIVSTPTAPIAVGIRVSGADRRVELIDFDGPMRAAIDISDAAGVRVNGCFVHTANGAAVVVNAAADVTLANNTFVRAGGASEPALVVQGDAWPILDRNLFGGYGVEIIAGASADKSAQLLSGNFVVASEPAAVR
jgi:hypothetical protein